MTATAIANLRQYLAYTDYTQYIRQEPIMATGISWHHFFTSFLYWKYVQQILVIQKSVTCFYVVKAVLKRMPNDLTIKQCVLYILSSFDVANIALYTVNSKFFHAFFSLLFDFSLFAIMFADTHTTCRNKLSFPNPEEHKKTTPRQRAAQFHIQRQRALQFQIQRKKVLQSAYYSRIATPYIIYASAAIQHMRQNAPFILFLAAITQPEHWQRRVGWSSRSHCGGLPACGRIPP